MELTQNNLQALPILCYYSLLLQHGLLNDCPCLSAYHSNLFIQTYVTKCVNNNSLNCI